VESAVLSLTTLDEDKRPQPVDEATYLWLVEGIFRHQRKQLSNALLLAAPHLEETGAVAAITGAGLDALARPEELSMADYVRLSDAVTAVETERGIHRPGAGGSTG
jgi:16S rRNA A1518/A1519 N6-dimethyltransferase RsmA/KsgA/DIM1 with predicted DNA glycosylase/AP lyase activity